MRRLDAQKPSSNVMLPLAELRGGFAWRVPHSIGMCVCVCSNIGYWINSVLAVKSIGRAHCLRFSQRSPPHALRSMRGSPGPSPQASGPGRNGTLARKEHGPLAGLTRRRKQCLVVKARAAQVFA